MIRNLTEKQMDKIVSSAVALVASANEGVSPYRQVTTRTALTIVDRSLSKTNKLPFSIREYLAVRDVSDFISVSQKNKTNLNKRRNTDLLPVCHPASTKPHAMTASALRAEKGKWISGDPRIVSDEAKSLIASAFISSPFSAEETYYLTRLSALPQGTVPLTAIVAAFGDGNSRAARSARAKLQRRDRRGRFAWQGGGMSTLIRRRNGSINRLTGRAVSQGVGNDDTFDVELPDGRIARVPAQSSEASRAYREDPNAPDGFSPIEAESVASTPTVNEEDLVIVDSPNGFRQQEYSGAGTQYTDDAYNVTKLDPNDADQMEEIPDEFFTRDAQGNLPIDESKPVYMVTRDDGTPVTSWDEGPMQSWGDVQDSIRVDEIVRDAQEGREPDPIAALDQETLTRVADISEEEGRDPYEVVSEITGQEVSRPEAPQTPEGEAFELTEFRDPTGLDLVDDADSYIAEGRSNQESEDYTDDPAVLSQMFSEEELSEALREAVTPGANGEVPEEGNLSFSAGDERVPAQALYDSLKEQGADAPGIMQGIYDDIEAPAAAPEEEAEPAKPRRKRRKGAAEKAAPRQRVEPEPEPEPETRQLPELFEGLTDQEKQDILDGGDYKQYLPENQEFDVPEGYQPIFSEPFENVDENPDFDPINLANNFEADDLREALAEGLRPDADRPGYGTVGRIDEDGEESFTTAPLAAIRDAIQMKGESTDDLIESVYEEGRQSDVQDAIDALEDLLSEDEDLDDLGTEIREDGTSSSTVTAPNGNEYTVGTRRNEDGGIDLVMSDSEGREFVESTGDESELEQLNAQAADYAKSIRDGDEVGQAFADLIDAEEVSTPAPEEITPEVSPEDDGAGEPTPTTPTPEPAPTPSPEPEEKKSIISLEKRREPNGDISYTFTDDEGNTVKVVASKDPYTNLWSVTMTTSDGRTSLLYDNNDLFNMDVDEFEADRLAMEAATWTARGNDFRDFKRGEKEDEAPTPTPTPEPTPTPTPEPSPGEEPDEPDNATSLSFSLDANGNPVWSFIDSEGRRIEVVARKNEYTGVYTLIMREPQEDGSVLEYAVVERLELDQDQASLAAKDLAAWIASGNDFRDFDYSPPEPLPDVPPNDGQGRTPPDPENKTPSKVIIPNKVFYHVDEFGNVVAYDPEYIRYLLGSDPSDLTNAELENLLELLNQMPDAYAKAYEAKRSKAEGTQIARVLGVPEPSSRFTGNRFTEFPDDPIPFTSDEISPRPPRPPRPGRPRRPRVPGEYVPDGGPPPRPRRPEYPIPGEGRKPNLNRRSRGLLAKIEEALNALLDFRMPDSFYPNLPQEQRRELFNSQLANLEQTLENLRTALRNYIKTKDGSDLNQEALDDIAAQIDLARRLLSRLERGGFRGVRGEERHPALVDAEDTLNRLSDWIEDAIDPDWSPDSAMPLISEEEEEAPRPRRPRVPTFDPYTPYPGRLPSRLPEGQQGWWSPFTGAWISVPNRWYPDNPQQRDNLELRVPYSADRRFFSDPASQLDDVNIEDISDDEAIRVTSDVLRDIANSMPEYGNVSPDSKYLEDRTIGKSLATAERDLEEKYRYIRDAIAKAEFADAWEEENEGEEFDFSPLKFIESKNENSPLANEAYLRGQIQKLISLMNDPNADPEEVAYVANSIQPVFNPNNPDPSILENPLAQKIRGNEKIAQLVQKALAARGVAVDSEDPAETFKPTRRTPKPSLPKPPSAETEKKPRQPRKTPVKPAKKKDEELTPKQAKKARDEKEEAEPAVLGPNGEQYYLADVPDMELDFSEEEFPPNEEQERIVKSALTRVPLLVVRALAGTGKSTTLKMIARQWLQRDPTFSILNLSFSKAIQAEASKTMPENVRSSTADSLANRGLNADPDWQFMVKRLNAESQKEYKGTVLYTRADIATNFGVENMTINGEDVGFTDVVQIAQEAVHQYAISADDRIGPQHFKEDFEDPANVPLELIDLAQKMWDDKTSPEGRLEVTHEDIFKQFALLKPDLRLSGPGRPAHDMLFVDEAQDINPVLAKLIADQDIPVVMVGDSNQAIFAFRGAVDELDKVSPNIDLPITKSYRFGPQVAEIGNRFLSLLKSPFRVEGVGGESKVVDPGSMQEPDAIITRTTLGKVVNAIEAIKQGKVVAMDANSRQDLIEFLNSARALRFNEPQKVSHPDLKGYSTWTEFLADVEAGKAGPKAKQLFRYISTREGTQELDNLSKKVKFPFTEGLTADRYIPEITPEELNSGEPFVIHLTPATEKFISKEEKERAKAEGKTPPRSRQSPVPFNMVSETNEDGSVSVYLWSNALEGPNRNKYLFDVKRVGFDRDSVIEEDDKDRELSDSPVPKNKNGKYPKRISKLTFVADENGSAEENALSAINDLRSSLQGLQPEETDISIITAHVSKGLEFDRVQISDDFTAERFSPQIDPETGEVILPNDEELRLAYVAVTRAKKELDPGGLAWVFDHTTAEDAARPGIPEADSITSDIEGNLDESFGTILNDVALNPAFYLSKNPETAKRVLEAKKNLPGADVDEIDEIISLIDAANLPEPPKRTPDEKVTTEKEGYEALNEQMPEGEEYQVPTDDKIKESVSTSPDTVVSRVEQELAIDNFGGGQWLVWSKDVPSADGKSTRRYEIIIQKNKGGKFSVLHRSHDVTKELDPKKATPKDLQDVQIISAYPQADGFDYLKTTAEQAKAELALALSRAPRTAEGQAQAVIDVFENKRNFDRPQDRIDNPAASHISADGVTDLREVFENAEPGQPVRVYDHVRGEWGTVLRILDSYSRGYPDYVVWVPDPGPDGMPRNETKGPAKNLFLVDADTGAWTPIEGVSVPDFYRGERRVPVSPPLDGYSNPPVSTKFKQDQKLRAKKEEAARKEAARAARERGGPQSAGPDDDEGDDQSPPPPPPPGDDDTPTPPSSSPSQGGESESGEETSQDVQDAIDALEELLDGEGSDDAAGPDSGPIPGNWTRADKAQFAGDTKQKLIDSLINQWSASGFMSDTLKRVTSALPADIQRRLASGQGSDLAEEDRQKIFAAMEQAVGIRAAMAAEQIMKKEVGSPSKIYKSDRGSTVAVVARDVSQDQIDYLLESVDQLESLVSVPNMTYIISNKYSSNERSMAATVTSDHIMYIRPAVITKGDTVDVALSHSRWAARNQPGMRVPTREEMSPSQIKTTQDQYDSILKENNTSGLLATLLHEMGHATDQLYITPTTQKVPGRGKTKDQALYRLNNPEGHAALTAYMREQSSSTGTYGKTAYAEAYAEAFAHWAISGGRPRSTQVAAIAEAFGWPERFPGVKRIIDSPQNYALQEGSDGGGGALKDSESSVSYRMDHLAPNRDYGAPAHDLEQMFPDFYSRPDLYRTGDSVSDNESLAALEKIKGDPNAIVTVYRSAPEGSTINPGDWVSLSETYARQHGQGETEDQDMPVFSMEVRAGDLFSEGNSINEFGWDPEETEKTAPREGEVSVEFLSSIPGNFVDFRTKGPEGPFDRDKAGEITVNFDPTNGRIYVGEGNHRVAAAKEAGVATLPVQIFREKIPDWKVEAIEGEKNRGTVGTIDYPNPETRRETFTPDEVLPEDVVFSGDTVVLSNIEISQSPYQEASLSPISTKEIETLEDRNKRSATRIQYPTTMLGMSNEVRKLMREGLKRLGISNYRDMDRNIEKVLLRAWPELEGKTAEEALGGDSSRPDGIDWYDEAGAEALRLAEQYGVSRSQAAAMIAATSPREPWESNEVIAEYIAKSLSEDHEVQIDALLENQGSKGVPLYFDLKASVEQVDKNGNRKKLDGKLRDMPSPEELRGKKLSELDPYVAAAIIRGHAKLGYRVDGLGGSTENGTPVNSEGSSLKAIDSDTGRPRGVVFNSGARGMGRAGRVFSGEDPDLMLNGHKVRSFYNNIADLQDPNGPGDVTVDSHALAIALGYKISSSSEEYKIFSGGMERNNLGLQGYYAPVADAYRRLAEKYGLDPRQVQAITWVQWRKETKGKKN